MLNRGKAIAAFGLFLTALQVNAEIVSWRFTGNVTSINGEISQATEAYFQMGSSFAGIITLDTSAVGTSLSPYVTQYTDAIIHYSFSVNNVFFAEYQVDDFGHWVTINNDRPPSNADSFTTGAQEYGGWLAPQLAGYLMSAGTIDATDITGSLVESTAIPTESDFLARLNAVNPSFRFNYAESGLNSTIYDRGNVDVNNLYFTAVPLPISFWFLASGLVALFGVSRTSIRPINDVGLVGGAIHLCVS